MPVRQDKRRKRRRSSRDTTIEKKFFLLFAVVCGDTERGRGSFACGIVVACLRFTWVYSFAGGSYADRVPCDASARFLLKQDDVVERGCGRNFTCVRIPLGDESMEERNA